MRKIKIIKIQIRSAQNVGKVWISRKKILLAPFGAIWAHFLRGPEKSKKCIVSLIFAILPVWGPCCYPPEVGQQVITTQRGWHAQAEATASKPGQRSEVCAGSQQVRSSTTSSQQVVATMGAEPGRVHFGPSGRIFCVGRKNEKNAKILSIFLGGPMGPIHSLWANGKLMDIEVYKTDVLPAWAPSLSF